MTKAELIVRTRQIIEDTMAPYRWLDSQILDHLQSAVLRLHALSPSTRYVEGRLVDSISVNTDAEIPIDSRYYEPITLYAAYLCYLNDATDTVNSERAAACLQRAERLMV